jgi:hypothetical protein
LRDARYRSRALVVQAKEDNAWLVQYAKREDVTEIEIEAQEDAAVCTGSFPDRDVTRPMETKRLDVNDFVATLLQEFKCLR